MRSKTVVVFADIVYIVVNTMAGPISRSCRTVWNVTSGKKNK